MQKVNLKKHGALLCAFLAVAAAAVLRQIGFCVNEQLDQFFTILRAAIYIGLFVACRNGQCFFTYPPLHFCCWC